jgi:hypothetical protein
LLGNVPARRRACDRPRIGQRRHDWAALRSARHQSTLTRLDVVRQPSLIGVKTNAQGSRLG